MEDSQQCGQSQLPLSPGAGAHAHPHQLQRSRHPSGSAAEREQQESHPQTALQPSEQAGIKSPQALEEGKKGKAQIHIRGKLGGGTREAQTMKGKQEETEGRTTKRGGGAGALGGCAPACKFMQFT